MAPRYRRPSPVEEETEAFSWEPVMVCILFIAVSLMFCSIPLGRDADADADRNSQGPVCQCGPVLCTSNRTQPGCAPPAYDLTCSAEAPRRHVWHPASARFNGTMDGNVFVFFILTVAAAEVAVGLAIIVALFRKRHTVQVDELNTLKN